MHTVISTKTTGRTSDLLISSYIKYTITPICIDTKRILATNCCDSLCDLKVKTTLHLKKYNYLIQLLQ